eukprot:Pgem_evm1s14790
MEVGFSFSTERGIRTELSAVDFVDNFVKWYAYTRSFNCKYGCKHPINLEENETIILNEICGLQMLQIALTSVCKIAYETVLRVNVDPVGLRAEHLLKVTFDNFYV